MAIFSLKFRAPMADTDAAGVVHFSNYFRYCEMAEVELFNSLGMELNSMYDQYNIWLPRVHASCNYKWPIKFNQRVRVDLEDIETRQ